MAEGGLPGTAAEITFSDVYPAMEPKRGNYALLSVLDEVSRALGHGPVTAFDPDRRGAGDVSFVAADVDCVDGLGAMGFAAVFGPGVLLSVIPVLAYQGTITLCARGVEPLLSGSMGDSITATGGLLVMIIPVMILEVRRVPLADYLPALAVAPLLTWWWR